MATIELKNIVKRYPDGTPALDGLSLDGSGQNQLSVHTGNRGDWVLVNETVGQDGHPTALPAWFRDCLPAPSAPATRTLPMPTRYLSKRTDQPSAL